jgi:hypothetical protein
MTKLSPLEDHRRSNTSSSVHTYTAYGLWFHSELPIPQFLRGCGPADISIRLVRPAELFTTPDLPVLLEIAPDLATLEVHDVGRFVMREGRSVELAPRPGVDEGQLRLYLVGIVTSLILYQRGFLVLHGSSLVIDDAAIALIGPVGAGKSTTAAALYQRGHRVLADDNTAVRLVEGVSTVHPGFPQLKVDHRASTLLGHSHDDLLELHISETKRGLNVRNRFPACTFPLKSIYVLSAEEKTPLAKSAIDGVPLKEAVLELLRNSAPTRFRVPDSPGHFLQCAEVAKKVPVFRVQRRESVVALPDLAAAIEAHSRSIPDPVRETV